MLVKTFEMWCLRVLVSHTTGSPKSLRVWLKILSTGLWEIRRHCLSFVSAEAQVEKDLSPRNMWAWFLSNRVKPNKLHRRSTKVLRPFHQQKRQVWTERDRYGTKWKQVKGPQNSTGWKQAEKTQLQTHTMFHKNGRMTQKVVPIIQSIDSTAMETQSRNIYLNYYELVTPTYLGFSALLKKEYGVILCLPHYCMLVVLR